MKITKEKLKWIPMKLIIGISLLGLAIAVAGIIFGIPNIYSLGLKIASPIYIIVVPALIIFLVLTPVAGVLALLDFFKKRKLKK